MACIQKHGVGSRILGGCLLALFLSVLAGAICPEIHKWLHRDADNADHACVITLILTGGNEAPTSHPNISAPVAVELAFAGTTHPTRVTPLFLSCHIPEHAPPFFC